MKKETVKHIFFDLDNTLWDHSKNSEIVLERMFEENQISKKYGLTFDTWHDVFLEKNDSLWGQLRDGLISKKDLREKRFKLPFLFFGIDNPELAIFFEENYLKNMSKMSEIIPGSEKLLEYLKTKYHLHIITNGFEEVSSSKVQNTVLKKYIDTLTCADEINVRKPDFRIFDYALSKSGAKLEESLLIGDDWIADIQGALDYGMQAIFYDRIGEDFQSDGVPIVRNLEEIIEIL